MQKIGIIEGNGTALWGGGSIQLEYDIWGQQETDIDITHLLFTTDEEPKYYEEQTYYGRTLHQVQEFNKNSLDLNEYDKIIVLTFPFLNKYTEIEDELHNLYKQAFENYKGFIGIVCYDYKKEVVLNNLGAKYPDLYQLATKIWVNNKDNPLIEYLLEHNVDKDKFYIENPQFMVDYRPEWLPIDKKYMNQVYYQGRSLEWKGYKEIVTLKDKMKKVGKDINLTLNGITEVIELDTPFIQYTEFDSLKKFKDNIIREVEVYPEFSPSSIKDLTSQAGFLIYYTKLPVEDNFFPEYAFIDAVRNGTVVIVPKFYHETILPQMSVADGPFLMWDHHSETWTMMLAGLISKLQTNPEMYEKYRENAYQYMIKNHGANKKIRAFLNSKEDI